MLFKKKLHTLLWSFLLSALMTPDSLAFGLNSGGATSVAKTGSNGFSLPAANLSFERRLEFSVGNSFFRNPWVLAPSSTTARDGLGPLFNTNACQNCHIKDGRGHLPATDSDNFVSALVRVSLPPKTSKDWDVVHREGAIAVPGYGLQLQDFAKPGMAPEVQLGVQFEYSTVKLNDGSLVDLRKPVLVTKQWAYGDTPAQMTYSIRVAPPMIGLGLLEAIPDQQLEQFVAVQAREGAVSGRLNRVWNHETQAFSHGRFGWKAEQPTLKQQNAAAFLGDMGITSGLFQQEECPLQNDQCNNQSTQREPEVSETILEKVTFYTRNLAVPKRRNMTLPEVMKGQRLFTEAGCGGCHLPVVKTGVAAQPELSHQTIHPYTDLLIHDMGKELSDNRPVYSASGSEWRTPPLWGIGLTKAVSGQENYLHDGRARTLLEAILWHGGEAAPSRSKVMKMSADERDGLIAFLNSL